MNVVVLTPDQLEDLVERAIQKAMGRARPEAPAAPVSLSDAAKHLGVSTRTVRRMIQDGEVGALRVRRRLLVDLSTLRRAASVSQLAVAARSG
jgi:excisionase family DNA binding protein